MAVIGSTTPCEATGGSSGPYYVKTTFIGRLTIKGDRIFTLKGNTQAQIMNAEPGKEFVIKADGDVEVK